MALYPIFLELAGRPVLIVGGGAVALRKAEGLVRAAARVTVVSPAFVPELESLGVTRVAQGYESGHMGVSAWVLVFAATDAPGINETVANDAAARGILCCRVDSPEKGDFVNGAMGTAGGITVAVSTGKASPVIAARVRDAMIKGIDPVLVEWAQLLEGWRDVVLEKVPNAGARRELLKRIAGAEMETALRANGAAGAQAIFEHWVKEAMGG